VARTPPPMPMWWTLGFKHEWRYARSDFAGVVGCRHRESGDSLIEINR
jgi:hypothetical protein